jgi:type II secretory pathway pseudopilin PulG
MWRGIMKTLNILISMKLAGQGRQEGYAMAALLVAMSIMAVMMTVAMPVWSRIAQREKEEELVFRGEQYARAIGLFQRKFANAVPPSIDVLVDQKFLRRKYKDPITGADFVPIIPGAQQAQQAQTPSTGARPGPQTQPPRPIAPGSQAGGVLGVTSRSTAQSIRLYKGRNHYNEWQFVYAPPAAAPSVGGPPGASNPQAQRPGSKPGPTGRPPTQQPQPRTPPAPRR